MMGAAGFEPATVWSEAKRSVQAELSALPVIGPGKVKNPLIDRREQTKLIYRGVRTKTNGTELTIGDTDVSYDLGPAFEGATVAPGTNLLVTGGPLSGKRQLALSGLAQGATQNEGSVIITVRDTAEVLLEEFRRQLTEPERARVGVVDCIANHQGRSESNTDRVRYASSPTDLTGIGIEFSELLEEFHGRGTGKTRVALDSLSPLLIYSDLQTVFRFLHVLTSRIEDADAVGIHTIGSTAHDAETINTLKQLFDGVVELEGGPESEPSVRVSG